MSVLLECILGSEDVQVGCETESSRCDREVILMQSQQELHNDETG